MSARPVGRAARVGHGPLGLALVVLAACGRAAPAADDAHDGANGQAARIVSLAPALTAIVTALGAADRLVGVTRYCDAPGVAVVGDLEPRLEEVLAARPDVVIMAQYGSQAGAAGKLAALDLDVRSWPLMTLADMREATLALGALVGREARAAELVSALDDALARAREKAAGRAPVKVLLVYDVQPGVVLTTGGGDHITELLAAAGAVNVAAPGPVTARLGLEEVLARAPDVILHAAPDQRFPDDAAALAFWQAFPDLPAVKAKAVHVWPDDRLARNGPHLAAVLDTLPGLLRP